MYFTNIESSGEITYPEQQCRWEMKPRNTKDVHAHTERLQQKTEGNLNH